MEKGGDFGIICLVDCGLLRNSLFRLEREGGKLIFLVILLSICYRQGDRFASEFQGGRWWWNQTDFTISQIKSPKGGHSL